MSSPPGKRDSMARPPRPSTTPTPTTERKLSDCEAEGFLNSSVYKLLTEGTVMWKHDFSRLNRGKKWVQVTKDGKNLKYRDPKEGEGVAPNPAGGASPKIQRKDSFSRRISRSVSFSKTSHIDLCHVQLMLYGPLSPVFQRKDDVSRVDAASCCFSFVMDETWENRTVDFAMDETDENVVRDWFMGLQALVGFLRWQIPPAAIMQKAKMLCPNANVWTLGKFLWARSRLNVHKRVADRKVDLTTFLAIAVRKQNFQQLQQKSEVRTQNATRINAMCKGALTRRSMEAIVEQLDHVSLLEEDMDSLHQQLDLITSERLKDIMQDVAGLTVEMPEAPTEEQLRDPQFMDEYASKMTSYAEQQKQNLEMIDPLCVKVEAKKTQLQQTLKSQLQVVEALKTRIRQSIHNMSVNCIIENEDKLHAEVDEFKQLLLDMDSETKNALGISDDQVNRVETLRRGSTAAKDDHHVPRSKDDSCLPTRSNRVSF